MGNLITLPWGIEQILRALVIALVIKTKGCIYQYEAKPMREVFVNTNCIGLDGMRVRVTRQTKPRCEVS